MRRARPARGNVRIAESRWERGSITAGRAETGTWFLRKTCPLRLHEVEPASMSEPAPAAKPKHTLYRFPEELTPEEMTEFETVLPDDVAAHHLRWLETGEGSPWPESSG